MKTKRMTYRLYPNEAQRQKLSETFGCVRLVYNFGVSESLDILAQRKLEKEQELAAKEMVKLNHSELCRRLTTFKNKEGFEFLYQVSNVALQQSLRALMAGWNLCFKKVTKRPTFKKKGKCQDSAQFTRSGFRLREGKLGLGNLPGLIKVQWSKPLPSEPSSCTVMRDRRGRYFVSFVVEFEPDTLTPSNKKVGLDLGLSHYAILSDGEKVENPRLLQKAQKQLKKAQRALSRKKKGSANRAKARLKVARLHGRIADTRQDFQHKLSTRLIRENQAIGLESLEVLKMVQNRHLARSISDASWASFVEKLVYKAYWYGRDVVFVDRYFPSSKTCSSCGVVRKHLALSQRSWTCGACGAVHDRDVNTAQNIKDAAGLAESLNARGESTSWPKQLSLFRPKSPR